MMNCDENALEVSIEMVQKKMSRIVMGIITTVGLLPLITTFINNQNTNLGSITYLYVMIYITFPIVFLLGSRVSVKFQSLITILNLTVIGVIGLFTYGLASLSPIYFVTACMLSVILLTKQESILILIVVLFALVGSGILYVNGFVEVNFDFDEYSTSSIAWISRTVTVMCFMLLILIILCRMRSFIMSSITTLRDKNQELTVIYEELSASDTELRVQYAKLDKSGREVFELAYYDRLTGLANRALFSDEVMKQIEKLHNTDQKLAILYIDLDNIQAVTK